jgi:hypothetical protein
LQLRPAGRRVDRGRHSGGDGGGQRHGCRHPGGGPGSPREGGLPECGTVEDRWPHLKALGNWAMIPSLSMSAISRIWPWTSS